MSDVWTLRTDGGARGNPGPAGAGFVIEDAKGQVAGSGSRYLGIATNNVAEYQALAIGLRAAAESGVKRLRVLVDSELVVRQVNGVYRVKNAELKRLHAVVTTLMGGFETVDVAHVSREDNEAADALANEAMDSGGPVFGEGPGQERLFDVEV